MRKIYWRRFSLSCLNLSILLICCIILIIMFHTKQENIFSFIYTTPITCNEFEKNPLIKPSTIPPHYLLIPYREFATRTSISCRSFKLDEPIKQLSKLHPRHSQYLRGTFPYVIPNSNIAFDDIEKFYTKILVNKTNNTLVTDTSFAKNITFENIPYKYNNGMWYPIEVTSAQRTAILVPLQGRDYNAKTFILNIHAFARRQLLTYTILLIEQVSPLGHRFNKGRLFNAGVRYIEQESLNITCLILHDVDLIPEHDGNFYSCESKYPKHTTIRTRDISNKRGYTRYYEFLIGGVLLLTLDMYKKVNGFSNLYWGWGGEDDDLSLRFIERRMCVVRPNYDLAIYAALPHPRGQRNNARFSLLTWSIVRLDTDGYKQIDSMIRIVNIQKTSTVIHLKLDVDADQSLYKPPSLTKFQHLINETFDYITTISKTITVTIPTTSTDSKTIVHPKKECEDIEITHAASFIRPEIWKWWDYSDAVSGPTSWGYYYPLCFVGRFQSPINIESRHLIFDYQLTPLSINNSDNVHGILRNDGRNLYIIIPYGSNINISGGPLQYQYRPVEIYIRLAPPTLEDGTPRGSEHRIDNRSFHGEIQLVAYNKDLYETYAQAQTSPKGIVILSSMLMLGGDASAQLRYVLHQAELLNNTRKPADIELHNLNLKELIAISSEYMTYEGSLTWPGCFESVTWIIFNQYQQVLSTYLQTLFPNILRFSNNRQMSNIGTSAQRNVRTNVGFQQWFRSSPSTCYPVNNILEYHVNNDFGLARI